MEVLKCPACGWLNRDRYLSHTCERCSSSLDWRANLHWIDDPPPWSDREFLENLGSSLERHFQSLLTTLSSRQRQPRSWPRMSRAKVVRIVSVAWLLWILYIVAFRDVGSALYISAQASPPRKTHFWRIRHILSDPGFESLDQDTRRIVLDFVDGEFASLAENDQLRALDLLSQKYARGPRPAVAASQTTEEAVGEWVRRVYPNYEPSWKGHYSDQALGDSVRLKQAAAPGPPWYFPDCYKEALNNEMSQSNPRGLLYTIRLALPGMAFGILWLTYSLLNFRGRHKPQEAS